MTTEYQPGIHDLTDDEYFAADAVSNSDLKLIARSPAHYYAARLDPEREPDIPSPAMLAGRCLHTAVLQPEKFHEHYAVIPEDAPRKPSVTQINAKNPAPATVDAINWWDAWNLSNEGRTQIKALDAANYLKIGALMRQHPELQRLLADCEVEQSIFARDPETGILCKCKTDIRATIANHVVAADLKSAEDARPDAFGKNAYNYGYFQQAAFYPDVIEWAGLPRPDVWIFAAFEKTPPYAIKLYQVGEDEMARGRAMYRQALNTYAECREKNVWPGYSSDIELLRLPAWARD